MNKFFVIKLHVVINDLNGFKWLPEIWVVKKLSLVQTLNRVEQRKNNLVHLLKNIINIELEVLVELLVLNPILLELNVNNFVPSIDLRSNLVSQLGQDIVSLRQVAFLNELLNFFSFLFILKTLKDLIIGLNLKVVFINNLLLVTSNLLNFNLLSFLIKTQFHFKIDLFQIQSIFSIQKVLDGLFLFLRGLT